MTPFDELHGQIKAMLKRSEMYREEAEEDKDLREGEIQARVSCVLRELDRLAEAFKKRGQQL